MSNHPLLDSAHNAMRSQHWALAARMFDAVLAELPQSLPARIGRARCAMLQAQPAIAVSQLQEAARLAPDNAPVARSLGVALLSVDSLEAAAAELDRARALDPADPLTRLHIGQVREQRGQLQAAAQSYYRALVMAQARGQWLDRQRTPAALQPVILHAMDVVDRERRRTLMAIIEPWRAQHGVAAVARVSRCLEAHLKTLTLQPTDAAQRPRFLYFPDLPAPRYFDRALFPWIEQLESATGAIRSEALEVLAADGALQPFLKFDSAEQVGKYLGGGEQPPSWDAFFFYRDGERIDANHQRCPATSAAIEALPLVRIRQHAPEICYSVLAPGTHILPHTGVTNIRAVVHLPLIVPADCAIEVGGETHAWRVGEVVVFDDTFEHHAWNRSDQRRVILLMDTWNPYLSDVEREAVGALIAGIGDFNRD
ncbi:MAG: aspartyl/asparaginyl beta-hydroxylase domain-containing protein [Rhodanobacteraceae bacterium]|nr:aspartyl/asparaginyl beta-hydroxylase domain-containing protein [Rhodanobacteraceae bacterium]